MLFNRQVLLSFGTFFLAAIAAGDILTDLPIILSDRASVTADVSSSPRWSDYQAPQPGYVVNVAEELDVATTIKYCNEHGLRFLAQSGAHGWADTFDIGENDVVINLRGLNSIVFDDENNQVTLGGGTLNDEWVNASYANGLQALNGGCNCVGVLGATLGGGLSRWQNHYGMPIDNVVSANLVTASGDLLTVSDASNPDLFWAILGAGPNFGVVTSVVMRTYPLIDGGVLWTGELLYPGDKLKPVVAAINALNLTENMNLFWGFSFRENGPVIFAQVSYMSSDPQKGRDAFRSLYDLEPDVDTTQLLDYVHVNDDTAALCEKGGRKPGWMTGLRTHDYPAFQTIWDEFVAFVTETGQEYTTVLVECYSNHVAQEIGSEGASYAHRDIEYYAWILFQYEDEAADEVVEGFGARVRDLWRASSGFGQQRTYINFAHGDESLEEIFGESLPRLRSLKEKWDPQGRFNQWFPIL